MTPPIPDGLVVSNVDAEAHVYVGLPDLDPERDIDRGKYALVVRAVTVSARWNFQSRGWALDVVRLTGHRRKKDGEVGDQPASQDFTDLSGQPRPHDGMPDWLVPIVDAAMVRLIEQTGPYSPPPPVVMNTDGSMSPMPMGGGGRAVGARAGGGAGAGDYSGGVGL